MTRTRDLLITNQLHYRLCYTSKHFKNDTNKLYRFLPFQSRRIYVFCIEIIIKRITVRRGIMNHRIALMTLDYLSDENRIYSFMAKSLSNAGWRVEIINPIFEIRDSERIYFRKADIPQNRFIKKMYAHNAMIKGLLESRADIAVICDATLLKMLPKVKQIMPVQIIFDHKGGIKSISRLKRKIMFIDAVITDSEESSDNISDLYGRSSTVIRGDIDSDLLISLCDELEKGGRYNI